METGVAAVAVEHLVGIVVQTTKAYLAVSLKKLFRRCLLTLHRLYQPLRLY